MRLFDLPPELVQAIVDCFVLSHRFPSGLVHVMRRRFISRLFKQLIDSAVFKTRFLGSHSDAQFSWVLPKPGSGTYQAWVSYIHSYLVYQARRERSTTSYPGRVYRAAQAIHEQDRRSCDHADEKNGDTTEPPPELLQTLVAFAVSTGGNNFTDMLRHPDHAPQCSETALQTDMHIASIYLGRTPYIADLIANSDLQFVPGEKPKHDIHSTVFGGASDAAAASGNLPMIQLLLGPGNVGFSWSNHTTELIVPCTEDLAFSRFRQRHQNLLTLTAAHSHREAFEFILSNLQTNSALSRISLESLLRVVPWPDMCNVIGQTVVAGTSMPNLRTILFNQPGLLSRAAGSGKIEIVKYLMETSAKFERCGQQSWTSPPSRMSLALLAAVGNRDEEMTKLLLDSGADPALALPGWTALMTAARKCSVPIARLLLDKGADVNAGHPPPIVLAVLHRDVGMFRFLREHGARLDTRGTGGLAMAIARMEGISWMVQVLMGEGVEKDESSYTHWTAELLKNYADSMQSMTQAMGRRGMGEPVRVKHWFLGDYRPWN